MNITLEFWCTHKLTTREAKKKRNEIKKYIYTDKYTQKYKDKTIKMLNNDYFLADDELRVKWG